MADSKARASGGVSVTTLLFLIFLILKLTDRIDWSWWWVTCPLWIPAAIMLAVLIFMGLFMLAALAVAGTVALLSR